MYANCDLIQPMTATRTMAAAMVVTVTATVMEKYLGESHPMHQAATLRSCAKRSGSWRKRRRDLRRLRTRFTTMTSRRCLALYLPRWNTLEFLYHGVSSVSRDGMGCR